MLNNITHIRAQFPILHQEVNGKPLVYFDNAATTQKPKQVIDALQRYYELDNANIHRAAHTLAARSTEYFEATRKTIQQFINAKEEAECIFTKGVTESINLVAQTWGKANLNAGDEVLITTMEHHSNIVPWQMICEEKGAILKVTPINNSGELLMEEFDKLLSTKTKIVACVWVSNALGTINPVKEIIQKAHAVGAVVLLDGAQACSHMQVDVQALDCDFLTISSHKLYGPTGVGVLYGKRELLEAIPPYQGGGEMIKEVTFAKTTYADLPHKFEAGTPNIAGGIVLGTAIDYMNSVGFENIALYENELLVYGTKRLLEIGGLKIIGTATAKTSVISFNIDGIHPYDIGTIIDKLGIAVRTGHHCAQPIMDFFKIPGTLRASFAFYNTKEEIDLLLEALKKAQMMLS